MKKLPKKLLFQAPPLEGEKDQSKQDFSFEQKLGDGAFGQVWRVRHKKSGKVFACKQVAKEKVVKMLEQFRREVLIMYDLSHPNIIQIFYHFEDQKYFYLIMEIAEGGNLFQKLVSEKCFNERKAFDYFLQVLSAVEYLHCHNPAIIHRDIKPENILIDKTGTLKLTDFGWSNFYSQEEGTQRYTMCGTYEYLAPEMVKEIGHSPAVDIWCLGILLYEMLCGFTPFRAEGNESVVDNIAKKKLRFPKNLPSLAKDLISKILEKNPAKRIQIVKIKKHDWFKAMTKTTEKDIKNNQESSKKPKKSKIKINGEALRVSLSRIKQDILNYSVEAKDLREKMIAVNKNIRETARTVKVLEQKILKKKIESLDIDHNISELKEYLQDADSLISKLNIQNHSVEISQNVAFLKFKLKNKGNEVKIEQDRARDLVNELQLANEHFLDRERYVSQLTQYGKRLKNKGSGLHRSKISQVSSLQASRDFLVSQITEHEKIVEMMESNESRTIRELLKFVKSSSETVNANFIIEEKIKGLEDLIYLKEMEIEKLKTGFALQKTSITKSSRQQKEKLLRQSVEVGILQDQKNKKILESKESLRKALSSSRSIEKQYMLKTIDLEDLRKTLEVIFKKSLKFFQFQTEEKILKTRESNKVLHTKITQRKLQIEQIEMELGTIKASILRIDCINL
jgi:serine/threonine protein kinase